MKTETLKNITNLVFAIGFIAALGLFTNHTYGYAALLKLLFFACGGAGLILNLLLSRPGIDSSKEFNLLFWVGSLTIFIGLVMRLQHQSYEQYVIIAGLAITGLSYFINPFKKTEDDQEDLLDN